MKLDKNLLRRILLETENLPSGKYFNFEIGDYPTEEIIDHVKLLRDANCIETQDLSVIGNRRLVPTRLTGRGHTFIEAARDSSHWEEAVPILLNNANGAVFNLQNSQFAGGFAETVQGNQVGGTINNQAADTPSLAEAAAEIQQLLKPLEASNSTAIEAEQTTFLTAMIPPTRRERLIGALQSAGGAALDKIPYGPLLKALVEGWRNPHE